MSSMNEAAEIMRIQYKYRTLILRGRITVSRKDARSLVGPDCAYHTYKLNDSLNAEMKTKKD